MKTQFENILEKYWGHAHFRPLQQEIIQSVFNGNDTLALLPTGGGKSICFQIPALIKPGIAIVISPLIALIKDQVEALNSKGINAISLVSGMSYREIDIALDNCIYSDIKFLFVSPERIISEIFQTRIKKMNVNLIAVDEAHCISQWGYDFRPAYLNISKLREILPNVKIIALTASATKEVQVDILEKLAMTNATVFKKSFERKNIEYLVLKEENKYNRILKILKKIKGTGVIYVRNRKQCKELSDWLKANNINSDFYHAGLDSKTRSNKQEDWMSGKIRVIVATNAFGMGIDKAQVRTVIHYDLPDSLEAYYQEAGRAGRDENRAFAVLLFADSDVEDLKRKYIEEFPSIKEIKKCYEVIMSCYQIAIGSGLGTQLEFDSLKIAKLTGHSLTKLSHSFKFLEREGYFSISDEMYQPSKLFIKSNVTNLSAFQFSNSKFDLLLKTILRSYSGLFDNYVIIKENDLALRTGLKVEEVKSQLNTLESYQLVDYVPFTNKPLLFLLKDRVPNDHLYIDSIYYSNRKATIINKINAMVNYVSKPICRSVQIREYFAEENPQKCGHCDVCLEQKKKKGVDLQLFERISQILGTEPLYLPTLLNKIKDLPEKLVLESIQIYVEQGFIQFNDKNEVIVCKPKGLEKNHTHRNQ